ncbi:MAG: type IV pili methyl-accepting chemotaxis transducer N-terminal domain-containing protein [Pseudomonadota bacterium]
MTPVTTMDPKRLWGSYVIALLAIFVLISVSHFAAFLIGGDGAQSARDVNLSGRQRMLSQRVLYLASAVADEDAPDSALADGLRSSIDLFEASHAELVSEEERRLPRAVREMYSTGGLDEMSGRFVSAARATLNGGPDAARELAWMERVGPSELLADLDGVVTAFEEAASAAAHRAEVVGYIGYGLAVIALLLEALLIFRPAHRAIEGALADLEASNVDLQAQEREAFAALEEAEEAWTEAERARVQAEMDVAAVRTAAAAWSAELAIPVASVADLLAQTQFRQLPDDDRGMLIRIERLSRIAVAVLRAAALDRSGDAAPAPKAIAFDVRELAETVFATAPAIAAGAELRCHFESPEDAPDRLRGDPLGLARTLIAALRATAGGDGETIVAFDAATSADGVLASWSVRHVPSDDAAVSHDPSALHALVASHVTAAGGTMHECGPGRVSFDLPMQSDVVRARRRGRPQNRARPA